MSWTIKANGTGEDLLYSQAGTPSLDLRFAATKSLNDYVSGNNLITFTRASSGMFVDSAGVIQTAATDVPRFDHDPTTGESLGLLVEEQRTNLLLRSEDFSTTWVRFNVNASSNAILAPDGTLTADKLTENNADNFHRIRQGTTSGVTGVFSVFLKAAERTRVSLGTSDTNLIAGFDLSAGSVVSGAGSIEPFGDGWYRCSISATFTTSGPFLLLRNSSSEFYTGDGTSGIYLWGAQLEPGSFPTSYIPTTTAAVTRNASLADLISGAIANNIRSFYVEFSSPAVGTRGVVSLNDNTANERASVLTSGTDPRLVVQDGGVEQANINGGTVAAGVRTRVAVRINADDFAISINGGAVVTDTSGTLPTVDRLMFGRTQAGEYLNGHISRLAYFPTRVSDQILRRLTMLGSYHPITFYLSKAEVFDDASKLTASDQTTSAHIADMNSYGIDGATVYYNLTSSSNTANHLGWVSENYFDNNIPVNIVLLIKRDGYSTLSELNAGYFDYELTRFALKIAEYNQYFSLTLLHEGNGDWYPWGAGYGTNTFADLVDAYERINTILTNNAARPYVNLTANFNRRGVDGVFEQGNSYLPDIDQVIDSFSITSFNRCGTSSTYTVDRRFEPEFATAYSAISAISSKPINVGETATPGLCATSKENWYRDMLLTLYKYPAIKTINFFFGDIVTGFASNDIPVSWGFASSSEKAAFKTILEDFEELIDLRQ
jgi:hypothetical protein